MEQFDKLLAYMREKSNNTSEMGMLFEKFVKQCFLTSPLYQEIYDNVWLWNEFPYNGGRHDFGIDLVAKGRNTDKYYAIQCKFYSEEYAVSKSDVDTFLTASGKPFFIEGEPFRFEGRIIISTTDKWTSTADDIIIGQEPPVTRIRLQDFKSIGIDWNSVSLENSTAMKQSKKKVARLHQEEAIKDVLEGFKSADRGKLIMACGTGKTFTSLRIVEEITKGTGNVLFLVPSISLLNQTLVEWTMQCSYDYQVFAVCSDPKASKTKSDSAYSITDTIIPATTDVEKLVMEYTNLWNVAETKGIRFFFSTYQSIDVIAQFQKITGLEFDITVCDESHRTTGVTLAGEEESNFVKVHDNEIIRSKKRLYMTATPRIYGDESKKKASNNSALLCSMDDTETYGEDFHVLGFSEAVTKGLLSDYKVIVLAVDEGYVRKTLQNLLTNSDSELMLDDSVKILGCLNGLSKKTLFDSEEDYFKDDPQKMKRAVAFSSDIKSSKRFVRLFGEIQDELKLYSNNNDLVSVDLRHVDGTQNALLRKECIEWLNEDTEENTCRILSNARCLSEGIDVPALDAVMFLNPRNSIVDIIQSVGRVMRKTDNKKFGYIILPIGIPAGIEPEVALSDNRKYKIIWDVLQALRAHDDRFHNTINKIELNRKKPSNIQVIGVTGTGEDASEQERKNQENYNQLNLNFEDLQKWKDSIFAKIVKKCGSRKYWETWAKDIADIANRHIEAIKLLIKKPEIKPKFNEFLEALQKNLNSSIKKADAIEMLAEHMITKPVFDALFDNYEFIKNNPVSIIMQEMLTVLDEKALDKEQETLDKFYLSVQERAKGIDNAEGKQKIVTELYEQFFKNALPKQVAKLGIVYTPIQVVDFIIQSIEVVLNDRFGTSLNNKGVHVLDPFTGTGTFMVQLLRSGIISKEELMYKYCNELHANEIVLLAYYIAAINIEETFHDLIGADEYTPFEGIVLTDTFELSETLFKEQDSVTVKLFDTNSERAHKQLKAPINVILGNPPYSVGQKSGNDNNQNITYKNLDKAIANSYAKKSKATLTRNVYDTYIKAFRWATDKIGDNGVVGFVSNGAYLDGVALDGFRQCLLEDFNSVYVFNLRGNQRTSGELSRKEGGKIFGSGARTPVAITILVKKKGVKKDGYIRYYDIGDYLSKEQKLNIIQTFGSIKEIPWKYLTPNEHNDWINQRNPNFMNFIALGDKKKREKESIFGDNYASGLSTNRDVWVYSFSEEVKEKANRMIAYYNSELKRCNSEFNTSVQNQVALTDDKARSTFMLNIRSNDETKISWSRGLFNNFCKNRTIEECKETRMVSYRPFCRKSVAYNFSIIEMPSKWDAIFPNKDTENLVICVSGAPIKKGFSVLVTDSIQDLNFMEHSICMPMYIFEKVETVSKSQISLFDLLEEDVEVGVKYKRRNAITDAALNKFKSVYGNKIDKEALFYYIYAVFHNKTFIENYGDNLSKEMARVPMLEGFTEYVRIGKELASLHLNYEKIIEPEQIGVSVEVTKPDYNVEKMKFKKQGKESCKTTIIYNNFITISNIPERAYEYVINGKSAIEWIVERYAVTQDKSSKITDDPNTFQNGKYIFDLLISIINVSIKTLELIDSMPEYKEI